MLKTVEDVSSTKKRLKIEIPPDAIEEKIKAALQGVKSRAKIPGFRPGKAPMELIEKRFGKEVEAEALQKIINEGYSKALKEADIRPVASPVFEEAGTFKRNSPLNMTVLVEVVPKLDNVVYEGIKVKDIPVSVDEAELGQTLKRLQEDKAVFEPSTEPVKTGDLVIMDYETREDGKSFKDQVFRVGNEVLPAEFSTGLIGMSKAEERQFDVSFPEGFHLKDLAGKRRSFKVTLKDLKKVTLPEIDDEFAKDLGLESLPALREHIRERLVKSKENAVRNILKAEIIKQIVSAHEFDAPQSLLDAELDTLEANAKREGKEAPARELLVPVASRNVRASLILQAIGEKEGISVSEDEMKGKLKDLAESMSLAPENVVKYYIARDGSLDGLRHQIFEEKVLGLLLEKAVIEKGE